MYLSRNTVSSSLDKIVAILGLGLGLGFTLWLALTSARYVYTACAASLVVICGIYLGLRQRFLKAGPPSLEAKEAKPSLYLILNIAFFILLASSLLSLALRSQPYGRPQGYFICTILAVAVLAAEILLLPNRRGATMFALIKIVIIALSLVWSQYFTFPTLLGVDPWGHQIFTSNILDAGHVPEVGVYAKLYSKIPCMHLMIGTTSLISGLDYKLASIFSISLVQVLCDLVFVFLLGKLLYSARAGLLAALLLGIANHHINLSWAPIPTTMAATFIPIVIFLLFKLRREKEKRVITTSLVLLFFAALILTHTVTPLCVALLLLAFWIGSRVYDWLFRQKDLTPAINLGLVVVFVVAMLGFWTYSRHMPYLSGPIRQLVGVVTEPLPGETYFVDYWTYDRPGSSPEVSQYMESTAFPAELLYHLGMVLFFALSVLGIFYLISRKGLSKNSFLICLSSLIPLALGFFPNYFNQGLMHRWWYFSQILLAVPLGVFFFLIYRMAKGKVIKVILPVVLISVLTFLMVMSPIANIDTPAFARQRAVRYAFTESEIQAVSTASNAYDVEIGIDGYSIRLDWLRSNGEMHSIDKQLISQDYTDCEDAFVLIREEVVQHSFKCCQGIYKLPYEPSEALTDQGFSRVYDCGSVSGFVE